MTSASVTPQRAARKADNRKGSGVSRGGTPIRPGSRRRGRKSSQCRTNLAKVCPTARTKGTTAITRKVGIGGIRPMPAHSRRKGGRPRTDRSAAGTPSLQIRSSNCG